MVARGNDLFTLDDYWLLFQKSAPGSGVREQAALFGAHMVIQFLKTRPFVCG